MLIYILSYLKKRIIAHLPIIWSISFALRFSHFIYLNKNLVQLEIMFKDIVDSFFYSARTIKRYHKAWLKTESVLFMCQAGYLINIYFFDNRYHAKFLWCTYPPRRLYNFSLFRVEALLVHFTNHVCGVYRCVSSVYLLPNNEKIKWKLLIDF